MIRTSYRRPVAISMAYLAVAILGVRAWNDIPIELNPNVSLPRLNVRGTWPGASPETVEAFMTSPIEAAVQLVDGVEDVTSTSREGGATIEALFDRDTDMDFARLDLSERITTLRESRLPPGIRVSVEQYVPREFQQGALLTYTFTGAHTLEALRAHLEDVVIPELSRVDGVSVVRAVGGLERMLEIEVDREAMAALGISTGEIAGRLGQLDLRGVAGAVRKGEYEWTVSIRDRPTSAEDVGNAIVRADRDRIIRVKDVAIVRDTWEDIDRHYRINTRPAVQLFVYKEIAANSIRVAELARERLAEVEARSPPNTRFILNSDRSERIERGISDVQNRVLLQLVAIFAVLLIFIGSVRSAVVMFSTIAFSVLITLNFIYFAGLSLNQITLIGLAMGFGLVLDNSIVVLENIFRRWQQGHSREEATRRGASNVVLPIMAATGTNIIVLVPFVYLQGDLRVFYLPFAIVVGLSLLASLLVAFSFIPALAGKILPERRDYGAGRSGLPRAPLYERFYRGLVTTSLRRPWLVLAVPILAFAGSSYLFFKEVNRGYAFTGGRDQPTYISIDINLPDGTDIERTDEFTKFFEARLNTMPEVGRFVSRVDRESSNIHVTFPRAVELTSKPVAIKDQLFAYSLLFSGIEVRVTGIGPSFYGGGGAYSPRYRLQVLGYNYLEVRRIAELLGSRLEAQSRVDEVNTNASAGYGEKDRATEFVVTIRRDVLASHGMTVQDLVYEIGAAVRGQVDESTIKLGGDEVRFQVKVEGSRDIDFVELSERLVVSASGQSLRLGDLVHVSSRGILANIRRRDQQYERSVGYEFRGPPRLGDVIYNTVIDQTPVPVGYTVTRNDDWRWTSEEKTQIYLVLGAAIILVFMLTAALFESVLLPLCVLLTVPMALIGVFMTFFLLEATFTTEAYFGVIVMAGIVVNNAILLVDHINRLRWDDGMALRAAVVRGTVERARPILMTTITTVVGLLPLVLFSETVNANMWNALAFVLIGGLVASAFFVLTVTPSIYYLFERKDALRPGTVERS